MAGKKKKFLLRAATKNSDCLSLAKMSEDVSSLTYEDWKGEIKRKFVQILSEGDKDVGYILITWGADTLVDNEAIVDEWNVPEGFFVGENLQQFANQTKQGIKSHIVDVLGPHEVKDIRLCWLVPEDNLTRLNLLKSIGWASTPTKAGNYLIEGIEDGDPAFIIMSC